ncbi:MAG: DUF3037 domain-containing protein [Bacteroidales bacterium]|nr:DUF3037 domain-containing protein [Bacteroidales bacterium]
MTENNIKENETSTVKVVYEYCVLRYVADIEREEFVNVGLLMMCKRYRWMRAETIVDEVRIGTCFRSANITLLRNQLAAFTRNDVPEKGLPVEERYRWLAAVKSAVIQTSPSHPGIMILPAETPAAQVKSTLDAIFTTLLDKLVK